MRVILVALNVCTQLLVLAGLVVSANMMSIAWFTGSAIIAGLLILSAIVFIKPERMHW
jgi:hypothetical protein